MSGKRMNLYLNDIRRAAKSAHHDRIGIEDLEGAIDAASRRGISTDTILCEIDRGLKEAKADRRRIRGGGKNG